MHCAIKTGEGALNPLFRKGLARRRLAIITVVLASLLAPSLLCAVPAAPMSTAEHECCRHMKMTQDCGETNMSACCTPVIPNVGIANPAVTKKVPALSSGTVEYAAVEVFEFGSAIGTASGRMDLASFSPPLLATSGSIQVLRI